VCKQGISKVVALEGVSNVSAFPTPLFPSPNPAGTTGPKK